MNALQSMMEEMNSSTSGMKVELKRQLPNGATVDASPEQLDSLKYACHFKINKSLLSNIFFHFKNAIFNCLNCSDFKRNA